ncbi:hypothetical protein L6R49_16265 [Myxococcota bacterium]|nr:hypothetical protein [Myxococcota bacterium]
MTPLRAEVLPRAAVTDPLREQMFHLLSAHFEGVERSLFDADLDEKDEVITLSDAHGALRGFSTLRAWRQEVDGAALWTLFSGDTIVDQAAWGSPALARGWLEAALRLRERAGGEPVWWMLICSGFRTYRFLPVFFHRFWPRYDAPTPPEAQRLIDELARRRYGARYDGGVVRLPGNGAVLPEVGGLTSARLQNPHVACFARLNPGHDQGDELVCLAEVHPDNFTEAARRMWAGLKVS